MFEFNFPSSSLSRLFGRKERKPRPKTREPRENVIVVENEYDPRHQRAALPQVPMPPHGGWYVSPPPQPMSPVDAGFSIPPAPPVFHGPPMGQPPIVHQTFPVFQPNPPVGVQVMDPNLQGNNEPPVEYFNPPGFEFNPEADIQRHRVAVAQEEEREGRRLQALAREQHARADALRESQRLQREEDDRLAQAVWNRQEAEREATEQRELRRRAREDLRTFELRERDRERGRERGRERERGNAGGQHIDVYAPPRRGVRVTVHNDRRSESSSNESWQNPGGDIRVQPVPEWDRRGERLGERGDRLRRERAARNPGGLRRRGTARN
jgi:hypothetical protein